jgi:hypothetical protein
VTSPHATNAAPWESLRLDTPGATGTRIRLAKRRLLAANDELVGAAGFGLCEYGIPDDEAVSVEALGVAGAIELIPTVGAELIGAPVAHGGVSSAVHRERVIADASPVMGRVWLPAAE